MFLFSAVSDVLEVCCKYQFRDAAGGHEPTVFAVAECACSVVSRPMVGKEPWEDIT